MNQEQKYKLRLVADIQTDDDWAEHGSKAAAALTFPDTKQEDLQYIKAVLVSTGVNTNGAEFMGSELIKSFKTVANKGIDIEHREQEVIGHIYDAALIDHSGNILNYDTLYSTAAADTAALDSMAFDIVVLGVVYKDRFPTIAQEVSEKKWKVSMECLYSDFDVRVGDMVITNATAQSLGVKDKLNQVANLYKGKVFLGTSKIIRRLKNLIFTGMGVVKNPANVRSLILEAAADAGGDPTMVDIDVFSVDKGAAQKPEEDVIYVIKRRMGYPTLAVSTKDDKNFKLISKNVYNRNEPKLMAIKETALTGVKSSILEEYCSFEVVNGKSAEELLSDDTISAVYEVAKDGTILSIKTFDSEMAPMMASESAAGVKDNLDSMCVSFKKYVYAGPGENVGKIMYEHWCSLFDNPCTVLGFSAKAPECLRNQLRATVKDPAIQTLNLSPTEVVDNAKPAGNSLASDKGAGVLQEKLNKLTSSVFKANSVVDLLSESGEKWTRAFMNSLPDASFAVIESDIAKTNMSGRHLPHHGKGGGGTKNVNLDLPHLRNAFARANQIKAMGKASDAALRQRAISHLNSHKGVLKTAKARNLIPDYEWANIVNLLAEYGYKID